MAIVAYVVLGVLLVAAITAFYRMGVMRRETEERLDMHKEAIDCLAEKYKELKAQCDKFDESYKDWAEAGETAKNTEALFNDGLMNILSYDPLGTGKRKDK